MKINDSLFQEMSANYEETLHFPPLTASIFTFLMFDHNHEGFTFDQILEAMNASKSSVSNALNRLLQTSHIEYINKIGERRRYYRINKQIFMIQFQNELSHYKKSKNILDRWANYHAEAFPESLHIEKIKLHQQLLQNKIELQEKMLHELTEMNKTNTDTHE